MPMTYRDITPPFRPFPVGDSIGPYEDTYYVSFQAVFATTLAVIVATSLLTWIFTRTIKRAALRRVILILCPVVIGLLALAVGTASHFYYGGPFCYENYRVPAAPADIVIWFSGSDDGAYGNQYAYTNYERSTMQFGRHRTALFNFRDIDQALDYASRLPEGSRLIVRGHSMGGASAVRFALRFKGEILLLDTRDSTSWFGHIDEKPSNVAHWRNILPEDTRLFSTHEEHPTSNYWGSLNMSNVFRELGRPWGVVKGADNRLMPSTDHHECGSNIVEDMLFRPADD